MRRLTGCLTFLLIWNFTHAQDSLTSSIRITTVPSQLLLLEFPLTVEKTFRSHAFGVTVAFRPGIQRDGKAQGGSGLFGYYLDQNYQNKLYNGLTVGATARFPLLLRYGFYIEGSVYYRYWWFNNKRAAYPNVEGYRFDATRTERQNVYGIKLLLVNAVLNERHSKSEPVIDVFYGLGVRYKTFMFETFNGTVDDVFYPHKIETGNNLKQNRTTAGMPLSVQVGLRVGIKI